MQTYFHRCAAEHGGQSGASRSSRANAVLIDLHCHVLIPSIERLVAQRSERQAELDSLNRGMGAASVEHNSRVMLPTAIPKLMDMNARLSDMDAMGVALQVISPSPTQYYYWADRELADVMVREQNEAIALLCEEQPKRLRGLGNIALQFPDLAVAQLEYAVKQLGLKGVEISTSVNGLGIGDDLMRPFWRKASELKCVVFVHPFGTSLGERLNQYYLANIIGQPLETTVALSELIFSGTFDACPDVKLLAAHGGGYLPSYIGRSDHGYKVRPESRRCKLSPSAYLKQIWFDLLVYDATAVRHLIDRVGLSQVVVGTDYPFDMGEYDPEQIINSIAGLSENQRDALRFGNALKLLGEALLLGRSS